MKPIAILFSLSCIILGSPIPDFPFIYVTGHASEEIPTNLATVRFNISKYSRVSEEGESALTNGSKAVRTALLDHGISDKDINSSEIVKREEIGVFSQYNKESKNIDPSQLPPLDGPGEPVKQEEKVAYYSFDQQFIIQVRDLKRYPDLARYLMRSSHVSRYDVDFSAINREEVIKKLRRSAITYAKQAAQEIAEATDEKLGRIHSASEMPYSNLSHLIGEDPRAGIMYAGSYSEDKVYEVPPTVTGSFNVYVLFRIDQDRNPKSEQAAPSNR